MDKPSLLDGIATPTSSDDSFSGRNGPAEAGSAAPRELTDGQLAALDHAGYLDDFAGMILQSPRGREPRGLGMATRLQWAARYIRLLQGTIVALNATTSTGASGPALAGRE